MVSTFQVLLGGSTAALSSLFTPKSALVFLVFSLLYTPCVAAIASVKRELGRRWSAVVVLSQCGIAWLIALAVNLLLQFVG